MTTENSESNVTPGPSLKNMRRIPVISWEQTTNWNKDINARGNVSEWRMYFNELGGGGFGLRVKDDSMTNEANAPYSFRAGMLLFVRPSNDVNFKENIIKHGQFVIAQRNNEQAIFRKYVLLDSEPYLEAINPALPSDKRYLKIQETDLIIGIVVATSQDMP